MCMNKGHEEYQKQVLPSSLAPPVRFLNAPIQLYFYCQSTVARKIVGSEFGVCVKVRDLQEENAWLEESEHSFSNYSTRTSDKGA